jgi:uncharacterized cupredoxin-like copper-binding protein
MASPKLLKQGARGVGETGRVTMTFDFAQRLLIGCHEPGHYEAGMVGSIDVVD